MTQNDQSVTYIRSDVLKRFKRLMKRQEAKKTGFSQLKIILKNNFHRCKRRRMRNFVFPIPFETVFSNTINRSPDAGLQLDNASRNVVYYMNTDLDSEKEIRVRQVCRSSWLCARALLPNGTPSDLSI